MASAVDLPLESDPDDDAPVLPHRKVADDTEMDITPMIDCTFLLLIFFIVCSTQEKSNKLELAPAHHGAGIGVETSVIITLADGGQSGKAEIYIADGKTGAPLTGDLEQQEKQVRDAVEEAFRAGKQTVMIKAEKGVHYRDVSRICAACGAVDGVDQVYLAVMEAK